MAGIVARHFDVGAGKRLAPVPGLRHQHAVDDEFRHFTMRVAVEDDVDFGHLIRQFPSGIFVVDLIGSSGAVLGIAIES